RGGNGLPPGDRKAVFWAYQELRVDEPRERRQTCPGSRGSSLWSSRDYAEGVQRVTRREPRVKGNLPLFLLERQTDEHRYDRHGLRRAGDGCVLRRIRSEGHLRGQGQEEGRAAF